MTLPTPFDFRDYKIFLAKRLAPNAGKQERGARTRIAQAMGCNVAYISQVISGNAHLSLEQGERACRFLTLSKDESDFFILLIQLNRAGTPELKVYFEEKLDKLLDSHNDLKNRLTYQKKVTQVDQATYYSAWYITAIHFLASIPRFSKVEIIAQHLGLSHNRVIGVLRYLSDAGLVKRKTDGTFYTEKTTIHLGTDSPVLSRHHANWRMRAIADLEIDELIKEHLHYSSVITLASEDIPKVRSILISAIEKVRSVVRPSKNERLFCYSLDFFEVGRKEKQT